MFFGGAAYAFLTRAHVNVDILYRRFSPRTKSIVDLFTSVLFFVFCIVLLWITVETADEQVLKLHFSLRLLSPPSWPVRLLIPIGVFLLLLQGLAKFARNLITALTGKETV